MGLSDDELPAPAQVEVTPRQPQAPELFDADDIVVYEALPGGERVKGSLADHAAG